MLVDAPGGAPGGGGSPAAGGGKFGCAVDGGGGRLWGSGGGPVAPDSGKASEGGGGGGGKAAAGSAAASAGGAAASAVPPGFSWTAPETDGDGSTLFTMEEMMVMPVPGIGGSLGAAPPLAPTILPSMVLEMVVTAEQLPTGLLAIPSSLSRPVDVAAVASGTNAAPPTAAPRPGRALPSSSAMKDR